MKPVHYIDILHRKGWIYKPAAQTDVGATFAAAIKAQRKAAETPGNVTPIAKATTK